MVWQHLKDLVKILSYASQPDPLQKKWKWVDRTGEPRLIASYLPHLPGWVIHGETIVEITPQKEITVNGEGHYFRACDINLRPDLDEKNENKVFLGNISYDITHGRLMYVNEWKHYIHSYMQDIAKRAMETVFSKGDCGDTSTNMKLEIICPQYKSTDRRQESKECAKVLEKLEQTLDAEKPEEPKWVWTELGPAARSASTPAKPKWV